jgi:Immunoglobulin domain/Immunoglobulin I-set domain
MKAKLIRIMSVVLAAFLQMAPLLRSFLPNAQGLAPSAWGFILKIGVGSAALLGFDAVSQASSISISPPNATVGQPYIGTVTYSGGHAGSVSSMSFSNNCIGTGAAFVDGLTIVYDGINAATASGTPASAGNFPFSIKVFDQSGCGSSGHTDTRATTLVVGTGTGGPVAPTISAAPPNTCAQVGTDVQLSGGASGNPIPQYQWWRGLTPIPDATNAVLTLPNVQLTDAGVYTLTASNSQTAGYSFGALPKANAYLSVAISGGTNFTALNFTNFAPAGVPLTMFSWVTNVVTATNYYRWTYNYVNVISTSNAIPLSSAIVTPARSGTYTVTFNSTNAGGAILSGQNYDSYWTFGYPPMFPHSPPATTNVTAGSGLTLSIPISGTLDVYNAAGGAGGFGTNSSTPCVFWYKEGNLVASQIYALGPTSPVTYSNSAVNATLTLNNVSAADAGNYTVVATNFWGSVTSSPIALTVSLSSGAPTLSQAMRLSNGQFQMLLNGIPNQNYTLEMSTNLSTTNWFTLYVTNNPASGAFLLADPNATNKHRFYRIKVGP